MLRRGRGALKLMGRSGFCHITGIATNGTIRRECLDRLLFWTATDLEMKLIAFRDYYNGYRSRAGLTGETPIMTSESRGATLQSYRWRSEEHTSELQSRPHLV